MPDITVTIPNEHVERAKAGWVEWYGLDPAISNADLLAHVREQLRFFVVSVVRSAEERQVREAADAEAAAIDSESVAT